MLIHEPPPFPGDAHEKELVMHIAILVLAALVLFACSQKPSHTESQADTPARRTSVQAQATPRDTVLRDTTRVLGTPGSPTGAESRGMPGEKPIPGTKK
jgi:hypothetical protein